MKYNTLMKEGIKNTGKEMNNWDSFIREKNE